MTEIQNKRRTNLKALISDKFNGNVAAFARSLNRNAGSFSMILANPPKKGFGETLARSLEKELELDNGWLDKGKHNRDDLNHLNTKTSQHVGISGLSDLQSVCVKTMVSLMKQNKINDAACIGLLSQWQPLLSESTTQ